MVVHYKFKSSTNQSRVQFVGATISVLDLKHSILQDCGLVKGRDVLDLELSDADTGVVYENDTSGNFEAVWWRKTHHVAPIAGVEMSAAVLPAVLPTSYESIEVCPSVSREPNVGHAHSPSISCTLSLSIAPSLSLSHSRTLPQ